MVDHRWDGTHRVGANIERLTHTVRDSGSVLGVTVDECMRRCAITLSHHASLHVELGWRERRAVMWPYLSSIISDDKRFVTMVRVVLCCQWLTWRAMLVPNSSRNRLRYTWQQSRDEPRWIAAKMSWHSLICAM